MDRFLVRMKLGQELSEQVNSSPAYSAQALSNQTSSVNVNSLAISEQAQRQAEHRRDTENRKRKILEDELKRQEEAARIREQLEVVRVKAGEPIPRKEDGSIDQPMHVYQERKRMLYVEDIVRGVWPKRTNELCKWDLQPFTGTPIGIPRAWDRRELKFHLEGYFCSFSCAMAYIGTDAMSYTCHSTRRHLTQLARDFYGDYFHYNKINSAPAQAKLSFLYAKYVKEGHNDPMSAAIKDFRMDSEKVLVHPHPAPPFIRVTQAMDEETIVVQREQHHQDRLVLMGQAPRPIACTQRGMAEQRKYVLARRKKERRTGAIGSLLGITYVAREDDDNDETVTEREKAV
jgi:hypothetical protein